MPQILDYSAGYPGGAAVARAGYEGVIRYLRKEGTSRVRPITAAELADMQAHGRTVALVYQHVDKARPTQGRAAGRHDAEWALARAREIGIEPRAMYLAVDFDAAPSSVTEYFVGAHEVLGDRRGAYGSARVLAHLFDHGLIRWGWQTAAWSYGRREGRAHLFQRIGQVIVGGIDCDVNDVLKPDYGQVGGEDMAGELADKVAKFMFDRLDALPDGHPFKGKHPGDVLLDAAGYGRLANIKLDALSDDEANIVAAVRQIVAEDPDAVVELTPEQIDQFAARVLAPLPEHVKEAVRAAFARAGQPEGGTT